MIATHDGRRQVCCDSCPARYPNTYAASGWQVMIDDAKAAGWKIIKRGPRAAADEGADLFGQVRTAGPAGAPQDPYVHTCPDCDADPRHEEKML